MKINTTSQEFFERKYLSDVYPWQFASSEYERNRYSAIIRALNQRQYGRAFEPGCSIGRLTARLADICSCVDAMDISATAVTRARDYCSNLNNVEIRCGSLPKDIPYQEYDLIVFSEIGYYFNESELRLLADKLVAHVGETGVLIACHWLGNSEDHLLSGDKVHDVLAATEGILLEHSRRYDGFRLDRWVKL
jgi:SAM-dependent methyltransferase